MVLQFLHLAIRSHHVETDWIGSLCGWFHCVPLKQRDDEPVDHQKTSRMTTLSRRPRLNKPHTVGLLVNIVLFRAREARVRCHRRLTHQSPTPNKHNNHIAFGSSRWYAHMRQRRQLIYDTTAVLFRALRTLPEPKRFLFSRRDLCFEECRRCLVCHVSTLQSTCSTCSWAQHDTEQLGS